MAFAAIALGLARAAPRRPASANQVATRAKIPGFLAINAVALLLAASPPDGPLVTLAIGAAGALSAFELALALRVTPFAPGIAAAVGIAVLSWSTPPSSAVAASAPLAAVVCWRAAAPPRQPGWARLALASGLMALAAAMACAVWVHRGSGGGALAFVYLASSAHDAFAQVVGQGWGRRRLVAAVSPSKTVEGALAGLLASAAMGAALAPTVGHRAFGGLALGLSMGVAALCGDLVASAIKRALGLGASGTALGAQGGVVDRLDSLMAAATLYTLIQLIP